MLKKHTAPDGSIRTGVGYVAFKEITPVWPDVKSAGGIALPNSHVTGSADQSQATWGRVVSCGPMGSRTTCEPLADEVQHRVGFPLVRGSWIVFRKANAWTVFGDVKVLQTCDVVGVFPSEWEWRDVVHEVQRLSNMFKECA